ncbi:MAG: radical SAM protein [Patescibacteria group bacterium]|jgi:mutator protein MutT
MKKISKKNSGAIIYDDQNRVLLQLRDNKPGILFPDHYSFFGGVIEAGETSIQALKREIKEELGVELEPYNFFKTFYYEFNNDVHEINIFICHLNINPEQIRLGEGAGWNFFSKDELEKVNLGFNTREVLAEFFASRNDKMINYKIRQEKEGGYLFERKTGLAKKISQDLWPNFMEAVVAKNMSEIKNFEEALAGINQEELGSDIIAEKIKIFRKDVNLLPPDCLSAPARVYFELTRCCTLKCKTCFNESEKELASEMTTTEIKKIIDELELLGTFEIRFTGGEPTTRPDFLEIISYAKSKGFYISLGTNGVYSDDKLKTIAHSGVDWFIVSLEGSETINNDIRGLGTYKIITQTLDYLSKAKKRVRLNCVVAKYNLSAIPFLAKLCDTLKIESLNLIPLRPYGRFSIFLADQMLSNYEFYQMIKLINRLKEKHRVKFVTTINLLAKDNLKNQDRIIRKEKACAAGIEAAVISPDGQMYGCSYSPASKANNEDDPGKDIFVAGNLRKTSLADIWLDSRRWEVFRNTKKNKNNKCQSCDYYGKECVGSCPIMAYYETKKLNTMDPYCFVNYLFPKK